MLRIYPFCIAVVLLFAGLAPGQENTVEGFTEEFIGGTHFIESRLVNLAEAVPADLYSWRPAEGVRSAGQVYRHAAFGNYAFIKYSGFDMPAGIDFEKGPSHWESAVTSKEEVIRSLKKSFEDLRSVAKNITDDDLERTVKVFGMEMTLRNFMVLSLNHLHEHLGQSIAYARSNGVVPPWSQKSPQEPGNTSVAP